MNRIAFVLLAGAVIMLPSCVKEQLQGDGIMAFSDDEVAFRIGSAQTKSAYTAPNEILEIATLRKDDTGTLVFQDEVSSLDDLRARPVTKGTPAYTENVSVLYPSFNVVALKGNVTTQTPAFRNGSLSGEIFDYITESENVYKHNYGEGIWGINNEKLPTYFFMRMPSDMAGVTLADNAYDLSDGSIHFSYSSPGAVPSTSSTTSAASAAAQQDILFTSYLREGKTNGEEITFYHALTGVKFANFFNNHTVTTTTDGITKTEGVETIIREVSISGLIDSGSCVVTPPTESGKKSADACEWTPGTTTSTFSQAFPETFADYSKSTKDLSNLAEAAASQNINENDGSLTFWFSPQELNNNVMIKVKFDIRVNGKYTYQDEVLEVSLGAALADSHKTWYAGELHTFTLRPELVGVAIEDTMDDTKTIKSDLCITNTGNVDQYVRVYIIGNWVGKRQIGDGVYADYDSILMGYTDNTYDENAGDYTNYIEVARWNDKDFTYNGTTKVYPKWESPAKPEGYDYSPYGEFAGLPPMGTTTSGGTEVNNWVRHDKFYYYTKSIGPGEELPSSSPLFDSYTIGASPDFWIADMAGVRRKAKDVHFVMDISVQAISVPYNGSTPVGYEAAWKAALGVENINDL